jgi:hypothetical protein
VSLRATGGSRMAATWRQAVLETSEAGPLPRKLAEDPNVTGEATPHQTHAGLPRDEASLAGTASVHRVDDRII